jgi:hypothetical protein
MILGLSHVVLASSDLDADGRFLESAGFSMAFQESNLPTHEAKRPFMRSASDSQSLMLFHHSQMPPLELIRYREGLSYTPSILQVVFPRRLVEQTTAKRLPVLPGLLRKAWHNALPGDFPEVTFFERFQAELWMLTANEPEAAGVICFRTNSFGGSRRLLSEGLGFVPEAQGETDEGKHWLRLRFRAPVPQWRATILLMEDPDADDHSCLDDSGFRCLSFLTTAATPAAERLMANGGEKVSAPMLYRIAGKDLRLIMVSGPGGVWIELLEVVSS